MYHIETWVEEDQENLQLINQFRNRYGKKSLKVKEAKTSTTENIYKGLEEYKSTKAKENEAYDVYDIMMD